MSTVVILVLLGAAAWRDVMTRTIPNAISIAIVVLGVALRGAEGWSAVGQSLAVALAVFVLLIPLHVRGLVGGADLKLLSALAMGLSPLGSYRLIAYVSLLGAALAAAYLGLRFIVLRSSQRLRPCRSRHKPLNRFLAVEMWRIRRGAALPYGVAIAAGAAVAFGHSGV